MGLETKKQKSSTITMGSYHLPVFFLLSLAKLRKDRCQIGQGISPDFVPCDAFYFIE